MNNDDRHLVLLISDDYQTMEVLEQTFVQANSRMLEATNLQQVVSAMQQEMPDIVVCDTDVKEVDRQNLQQSMPDNLELQSLPFVFLYSTGPVQEVGRYLDLDQYLHKPFTPIALVSLVERMLANKESLAQYAQADSQTAVVNRRVLRKEIFRELKRIERHGGNMSVCILDIVDQRGVSVQPKWDKCNLEMA